MGMQAQAIHSGSGRVYWLDSLRGLAIFAVVLGHINLGIMQAGLVADNPHLYKQLHILLYLVHMPLFAFLFGLNVPSSWEKRGSVQYALSRLWGFAYLYLLWTLIQGTLEVLGSRYSNGNTSWGDVLNLIHPLAHLWYLPWAFITYLLLVLLRPWKSAWVTLFSLIGFGLLSYLTWGGSYEEFYLLGTPILIFALLGSLLGRDALTRLDALPTSLLGFGAFLFSLIPLGLVVSGLKLTVPTLGDPGMTEASKLLGMLASFSGVLGALLSAALVSRFVRLSFLETLGFYSLQIYLMHLLVTPVARIAMVRLGLDNPLLVMSLSLLAGVGIPLGFQLIFKERVSWLFAPPRLMNTTQ